MIRVPFISQKPELPAGCEVVSLAMVLAHRGYPVDKCRLAAEDLPKGCFHRTDPNRAYLGDPATRLGWYCFPPVIVETGNRFLARHQAPWQTVDLTGLSDAAFRQLLWASTPVMAWITDDLAPPRRSTKWCWPLDGQDYRPFSNLHCVVVQGWEDGMVWVLDPLTRPHFLPEEVFCPVFHAMGRRAAAIQQVAAIR